jgi:hypothetical protein
MWRAADNPAADQTTRDDAQHNAAELFAKRLAREVSERAPEAPSPYVKISFMDLALDRLKLQPGQKVEMTGNLETLLSGTMVFCTITRYPHARRRRGFSVRSL